MIRQLQLELNAVNWSGSAVAAYDDDGRLVTGAFELQIFERGKPVAILDNYWLAQAGTLEIRGQQVMTFDSRGRIRSINLIDLTEAELATEPAQSPFSRGWLSPSARRVAVRTTADLQIHGMCGTGPICEAFPRTGALMTRLGGNGGLLATSYNEGGKDSRARLWDLSRPTASSRLIDTHPYLVFRTGDRPVLWEATRNSSATWRTTPNEIDPLPFSDAFYSDIDFTPDGRLAIQATDDGTIEIYDLSCHVLVEARQLPGSLGFGRRAAIDVARDGRWLAVSTHDGWLSVWDLTKPGLPVRIERPDVGLAAWCPSNDELVCVLGRSVCVRDAETLQVLRGPVELGADINFSGQGEQVAVTADGQWAVVCTLAGTQLFDLATLTAVGEPFPHDPTSWCSAIDETASLLVTNEGEWAKVWTLDPDEWLAAARRIVGKARPRVSSEQTR